jgi:hypothetical protein
MEVGKIKSLISKDCRAAKFDDTGPLGDGRMAGASLCASGRERWQSSVRLVKRMLRKNAVSGVFAEWLYANCHSFQPTFFLEAKMAFVNEGITGENLEQYGIPEIKRRIVSGHYSSPSTCTIAHERGISLIKAGEERDDDHRPTGLYGWVFMWHGHELWVETMRVITQLEDGGTGWPVWRLTKLGLMGGELRALGKARHLPPELVPHREEILKDFHDALLARMCSSTPDYELTLEIAEGV